MKTIGHFTLLILALCLSNVVGAGVLQILLEALRPDEAFSCIAAAIVAVSCALIFLDGVVHLGAKYVKRY